MLQEGFLLKNGGDMANARRVIEMVHRGKLVTLQLHRNSYTFSVTFLATQYTLAGGFGNTYEPTRSQPSWLS
jgi:hypothetical protein